MSYQYNIAEINLCTECEGPFKRMAIWFQGCNIRCKGCCNPQLQPFVVKNLLSVEEIVSSAKKSLEENDIEGVTFLGGEPTLQQDLPTLAHRLQEIGLGVILFTGKLLYELSEDLISGCDIIIDGNFDLEQIDTKRNLIGSVNQQIHCITSRYENDLDWFFKKRPKKVRIDIGDELHISGDVL